MPGTELATLLRTGEIDPDGAARIAAGIRRGQPFHEIVRSRDASGETRWTRVEKIPLLSASDDDMPRPDGWISIRTDVSEEFRTREALERTKERLQAATIGARVGIWDWNPVTDEAWFSDEWERMLGYEPGSLEHTGETWLSLVHPDDRDDAVARVQRHLAGDGAYRSEFRMRRADGGWKWVLACGSVTTRDDAGNVTRVAGVHVDIDSEKSALERVEMSRRFLEASARIARVGGWKLELDPMRVIWSDEVRALHEVPPDFEPDLETAIQFYEGDSRDRVERLVADAIAGRSGYEAELELRTWTGRRIWTRVVGEPVIEDDRVVALVGAFQDITEQRRIRESALVSNRAKSEFLANMSHEIRTPIAAVIGYADLVVESDAELDPTVRDAAATIRRNGEHLLGLVNDILDLSKIEAGKLEIERRPVDPLALAREVVDLVRVRADGKGIDLALEQDGPVPAVVDSDPVRLRQILTNLVGNAVKFTEVGGVRVVVGRSSTAGDVDALAIRVVDTGIGMTDEQRTRLFRPFEQGDASTTRRFGGTGLGLEISARLARMLGATIDVESAVGAGSTFTLALPIDERACARWFAASDGDPAAPASAAGRTTASSTRPSADAAPLAGVRVLLAEDGPDNRRLFTHHLERAGAAVTHAANGREALAALGLHAADDGSLARADAGRDAADAFDVVLMDMQMPELDGYTAALRIRESGIATPVIALTAHAMAGDRDRCLGAGCDDYLPKPVSRDALVAACERWSVGRAAA